MNCVIITCHAGSLSGLGIVYNADCIVSAACHHCCLPLPYKRTYLLLLESLPSVLSWQEIFIIIIIMVIPFLRILLLD